MQPSSVRPQLGSTSKLVTTGAVLTLIVVFFVITFVLRHIHESPGISAADKSLQRTARTLAPALKQPNSAYVQEIAFFPTFSHWATDERAALVRAIPQLVAHHQFAQVQLFETRTDPPDYVLLTMPGHSPVTVDGPLMLRVAKNGASAYSDARLANRGLRVYLTPLSVPDQLSGGQVFAVLEVLQ